VDQVFAPGHDAVALLLLWCLRSLSLLLVAVGACIGTTSGTIDSLADGLATPGDVIRSLLTPLMVLVVGILLRATLAPLAWGLAFAFVLTRGADVAPTPSGRSLVNRWSERARLAGAFRALRWTTAVRDLAVTGSGTTGVRLRYADLGLRSAALVAGVLFVVLVALR
jgi:hypothetical protein